jgi:stage IV sporulation protein FB
VSNSFDNNSDSSEIHFPSKPVLVENNQNVILRSLISLFIYGLFFYFLFDKNLAYIATILLVIIVHEMGHFLFMKIFSYSNVKIFIIPLLGALTSGKKQNTSQWQLSVIILAGPLPGIIIGTVLYWFINILNCLPFHPLDGGRLIETLFFQENHLIRIVFGVISIIALLILFIALKSFLLIFIPFLIGVELYNENKHQKIREYLKKEKINYFSDYENLKDKDYWLIRDCLLFSFPKKFNGTEPGVYQYSFVEPIILKQVNLVLQVNLQFDLNLFKRLLMLFFYIFILIAPIVILVLTSNSFVI